MCAYENCRMGLTMQIWYIGSVPRHTRGWPSIDWPSNENEIYYMELPSRRRRCYFAGPINQSNNNWSIGAGDLCKPCLPVLRRQSRRPYTGMSSHGTADALRPPPFIHSCLSDRTASLCGIEPRGVTGYTQCSESDVTYVQIRRGGLVYCTRNPLSVIMCKAGLCRAWVLPWISTFLRITTQITINRNLKEWRHIQCI